MKARRPPVGNLSAALGREAEQFATAQRTADRSASVERVSDREGLMFTHRVASTIAAGTYNEAVAVASRAIVLTGASLLPEANNTGGTTADHAKLAIKVGDGTSADPTEVASLNTKPKAEGGIGDFTAWRKVDFAGFERRVAKGGAIAVEATKVVGGGGGDTTPAMTWTLYYRIEA